jgi:hypothetical protein
MATSIEDKNLQEKATRYLHQTHSGQQGVSITIDGKTLRGAIPRLTAISGSHPKLRISDFSKSDI